MGGVSSLPKFLPASQVLALTAQIYSERDLGWLTKASLNECSHELTCVGSGWGIYCSLKQIHDSLRDLVKASGSW